MARLSTKLPRLPLQPKTKSIDDPAVPWAAGFSIGLVRFFNKVFQDRVIDLTARIPDVRLMICKSLAT